MEFTMYTWKDAFFPLVTKWFKDEYAKNTGIIEQLIDVTDTKRAQWWEYGAGGTGEVPDYDGSNLIEMNKKKGFKTMYETKEKAGIYRLRYKDVKFDLSGYAKDAGTDMSESLYMTILMNFYRFFSNGFNKDIVGADGQPLFSAVHLVNGEDTETFSNLGTATFSVPAMTTAMAATERWKTYDGLPYNADFNIVLVSPELESKCKEYFGENSKLLPDGNNNNSNPVQGTKYFVMKGFSAKQWALGDARKMKRFMKLVYGTRPQVIDQKAQNPLISEFIPYVDYTLGYSDPRCIFGFNPA